MDALLIAHGETTLAVNLNTHGEASVWTLC